MKRYVIRATKRYKKDYKRLSKANYAIGKLERVIDMLAEEKELPASCHDHPLQGALQGTRACHIGPDWLLRYAKDKNSLMLLLISTGDHRRVVHTE